MVVLLSWRRAAGGAWRGPAIRRTHERRPVSGPASNATDHPAGTDSRGRPPPRWCSNYNCRSLHITSFRSLTTIPGCRDPGQASISRQPDAPVAAQRLPVACAEHLERRVDGRVVAGRGSRPRSTTTSGTMPVPLIHTLSGVSHLAVVSRKPPWSSSSCVHCWTVPLPKVVAPTSVARPRSRSAPATISDADADPPSMRATTLIDGSVAAPPRQRDGLDELPSAYSCQKIGPSEELARDVAGGRHVAARVAAQVDDERPAAALHGGRDRRVELRRGMVGEARQPDVAHRALGEVLASHLLGGTMTARTISTSNGDRLRARSTASPRCPSRRGRGRGPHRR